MNNLIILVKLLCAHFCSDFVLQTDKIYKGKSIEGYKGILYHVLHSLIHAVITYLFVADWTNWMIPLAIFVTHFFIDFVKYKYCKPGVGTFLTDQAAHILIILILWITMYGLDSNLYERFTSMDAMTVWTVITAYLLVLQPSSILLGLFLKQWTPESGQSYSLPKAGQWIGYLERVLILTFIFINSLEGVGFLLAAKSVFRFGELNKAKEIKTTEYVLIGTMSSFAVAILVGVATRNQLYVLSQF